MDTILLIDDEPDIVRVLSRSLKADGYRVLGAPDGAAGLALFQQARPPLVITDIKMPGLSGLDVLKQIKGQAPDTEVIIITGHGDIDSAIEALHHGASDFINKPVRDEALTIALRRARDKIAIRRQLQEHTHDLEHKIERATREIRRRASFQLKLIASSTDGIVATDETLRIVIYNPAAESIFGYSREQALAHLDLATLLPADLAQLMHAALLDKSKRASLRWRETQVRSQSGESIPVRFSGSILREKGRPMGSVAFFQDLRELKELERQLVQSERLAAVGQTVAGLAHGIKNILHGLKGGSYLVDLGIQKQDRQRLTQGWEMIKRSIGRTGNLVMDMLSYSRERKPQLEECDPNEIAAEVCALVEETARASRIELRRAFDPAIGRGLLDPTTLHTVLLNMLSNAVDACRFDEVEGKQWQVSLKTEQEPGGMLRFEVRDNGMGMSAEVLEKLFSSFFSTKGHHGTGLGMLVSRKLIQEHGGTIAVSSKAQVGTTVTARLPFRALGQAQQAKPPQGELA